MRCTQLHDAPVFNVYQPNNGKVECNALYRGAKEWNALPANERNLDFNDFEKLQKNILKNSW